MIKNTWNTDFLLDYVKLLLFSSKWIIKTLLHDKYKEMIKYYNCIIIKYFKKNNVAIVVHFPLKLVKVIAHIRIWYSNNSY